MEMIQVNHHQDGTSLIVINRPARKNAICATTALELQQAFAEFDRLDTQRVAVISGCGNDTFSAGAEVIKVEPREGDSMRVATTSKEWAEHQLVPAWMAVNANKRSITHDLTKPEAIAVIHKLVQAVDVVCENFRPGVMDKLGIGYATLSALNPRLIDCGISGFGNTGPERRAGSIWLSSPSDCATAS